MFSVLQRWAEHKVFFKLQRVCKVSLADSMPEQINSVKVICILCFSHMMFSALIKWFIWKGWVILPLVCRFNVELSLFCKSHRNVVRGMRMELSELDTNLKRVVWGLCTVQHLPVEAVTLDIDTQAHVSHVLDHCRGLQDNLLLCPMENGTQMEGVFPMINLRGEMKVFTSSSSRKENLDWLKVWNIFLINVLKSIEKSMKTSTNVKLRKLWRFDALLTLTWTSPDLDLYTTRPSPNLNKEILNFEHGGCWGIPCTSSHCPLGNQLFGSCL